jgi:nucleoid-associated protein YgaU
LPLPEPDPLSQEVIAVRSGDTLTSLALRHYGDRLDYRRIYAVNRDVIDNPSLLQPGTQLVLPR